MLPEIDVIPRRDPALITEDDFSNGPQGWTQLLNGNVGAGVVYLDHEITYNGSPYSLLIGTGEQTSIGEGTQGVGASFKRLSRGSDVGKVYAVWKFAYGSRDGETHPRNVDFGVDQCDPNGQRAFFKIRWLNWDESTNTRVSKFQVNGDPASSWVDVPGAAIDLGYNENKRNLWTVEAVFDIAAGLYDGLRVNGQGFGSLASPGDNALRNLSGPNVHTLNQFKSGFNCGIEVYNRLTAAASPSWVNLAYFKAVSV